MQTNEKIETMKTTKLERSMIRMNKVIEKELDTIREEAKTNRRALDYQTMLWTLKHQIND